MPDTEHTLFLISYVEFIFFRINENKLCNNR